MVELVLAVIAIIFWYFASRAFFRACAAVIFLACKMDHSHGAAHSFPCFCVCHKPR